MSTESDWIDGARRGDALAWEELVSAHQQPVFRLAYLLLGDPDEAEDVAQETFIHAFRALGSFDAGRMLRPWLLRIAANLASNQRRSAGRYFAALQRFLARELPSSSAKQQAEEGLEAGVLWDAIRKLRLEDQKILYLRYFLDCSITEISATLDIPDGTVKSRVNRALARLRSVYQPEVTDTLQEGKDAR